MEQKSDHKDDKGKLRWHLFPMSLMKPIVEIYEYGLQKYNKEGSWAELKDGYTRYYDAFFRHLEAHERGQFLDPESGYPHIQHCAWNALAMLYYATHKDETNAKEECITD